MSKPSIEHIDDLFDQIEDEISGLYGESLAIIAIENARETIYDLLDETTSYDDTVEEESEEL